MSVRDGFVETFDPPIAGRPAGPLLGARLAVKDNFDVAGTVTGAGSPAFARAHGPAARNAALVDRLLELGASICGKTQMDELAYGLMGQNAHYGTPLNPAAPSRMPGGSSSGSASAVAAGLADIGLGSDTGGSVRVPAAFCGLFGWRPTHGALSTEGMLGLAPSYDVPGFMTRDARTLFQLGSLLVDGGETGPTWLRAPRDLWAMAGPETTAALRPFMLEADDAPLLTTELAAILLDTFRLCQGADVADLLGPWIATNDPDFGPGVAERFAMALALDDDTKAMARANREAMREHLLREINEATVVLLPTVPGPAPLLTCEGAPMEAYRAAALSLLCLAGHAGLPQVSVPMGRVDEAPVALSLVGAPGTDTALLAMAAGLANREA